MEAVIAWLAPMVSAIIVAWATASINQRMKMAERKADERHEEAEAERKRRDSWREGMSARIAKLEEDVRLSNEAHCSQIRADIVHKCHRYLDDLGCASTEEKQSLDESYRDYLRFCKRLGIKNHFIDNMVGRAMGLPEREL